MQKRRHQNKTRKYQYPFFYDFKIIGMILVFKNLVLIIKNQTPCSYCINKWMQWSHETVDEWRDNGIGSVFERTPVVAFNAYCNVHFIIQTWKYIGYSTWEYNEKKSKNGGSLFSTSGYCLLKCFLHIDKQKAQGDILWRAIRQQTMWLPSASGRR